MNRPSRSFFVHKVDVIEAGTEQDATASLAPTDTVLAANVTCLVVDKGGGRVVGFSRELERKHVRVLFPDPIALRVRHKLRFGARTLVVDSFRDDVDLGRLFVAECQEEPDPNA